MRHRLPTLWLALFAGSACGGRSMYEDYRGENPGSAAASGGTDEGGSRGGAPSAGEDPRLQPFEIGRGWQYRLIVLDPSRPTKCEGPLESSVSGRVPIDGEQGFVYHPSCFKGPVAMLLDGDSIQAVTGGVTRIQYASPPVVEGAAWDGTAGVRYAWHDEGAVTVDAGTFQRCWRRHLEEDSEEHIILCRGTGLVITNVPSSNFRLELSGKNF